MPRDGDQSLGSVRARIGARVAELREARGLTVRGLGEAAGVTGGFVSQLENGHVMPSVATLIRIASALGAQVGDFFEGPSREGEVLHPENRVIYEYAEHGVIDELLSDDPTGEIEVLRSHIEPGGGTSSDHEVFVHDTRVEVVYVLAGEIEIGLDERRVRLQTGDSMTFPGTTPHGAWNTGDEPAVLIWVAAPARY